ncbi:MAG: hypothetical protein ACFFBP_16140 [Promethearchaeota archaeon]
MVDPNLWTYLNGMSATIACIVGYIIGFIALFRYLKEKRTALSYVSYIGFFMGTVYLDITLSFITVLVFHENLISPLISGWITFTPSIGLTAVLSRLATKTFLIRIEKLALILIIILVPLFLFLLYWIPLNFGDLNIVFGGGEDPNSFLIKPQAGIAFGTILTFFLILNIYVFSGGFYKLSRKLEGQERTRCLLLTWAFLIFSIGSIIEITIPAEFLFTNIILFPTRILLVICYFLFYQGFLYYK